MIRLDLDLAIPERSYGWFAGRSGLALNHGIIVHNELCLLCRIPVHFSVTLKNFWTKINFIWSQK